MTLAKCFYKISYDKRNSKLLKGNTIRCRKVLIKSRLQKALHFQSRVNVAYVQKSFFFNNKLDKRIGRGFTFNTHIEQQDKELLFPRACAHTHTHVNRVTDNII